MSSKASTKKASSTTKATPAAAPAKKAAATKTVAATPAAKAPKAAASKKVAEPVEASSTDEKKPRRKATKISLDGDLTTLIASLEARIEEIKGDTKHKGWNKFLRNIKRQLGVAHKDVRSLLRMKKDSPRASNSNSGFRKPVPISKELSDFLEVPAGEDQPRTAVTVKLCAYVKEHGLQDQECRKNINPDDKLAKLLRYDKSKGALNFLNMQKYVQCHFPKQPPAEKPAKKAAPAPAAAPAKKAATTKRASKAVEVEAEVDEE